MCFSVKFAKFLVQVLYRTSQDDCFCKIKHRSFYSANFHKCKYSNAKDSYIFHVDLYYNQMLHSILMIMYIDILNPVVIL